MWFWNLHRTLSRSESLQTGECYKNDNSSLIAFKNKQSSACRYWWCRVDLQQEGANAISRVVQPMNSFTNGFRFPSTLFPLFPPLLCTRASRCNPNRNRNEINLSSQLSPSALLWIFTELEDVICRLIQLEAAKTNCRNHLFNYTWAFRRSNGIRRAIKKAICSIESGFNEEKMTNCRRRLCWVCNFFALRKF